MESDEEITSDSSFSEFECHQSPEYIIRFKKVHQLPAFNITPIAEGTGFCVFNMNHCFLHQFFDIDHVPYAISKNDWNKKTVTVQYLERGLRNLSHAGGAFFHIGWEEILLREKRLILHACCVDTALGGILFSGNSGIGKSTQGALWCRYEKARLINEDRPIIHKDGDGWKAYGSPYAGSSKCHINKFAKVKAVIMLAQAETCTIRRLEGIEAFRRVFAQTTVENWNPENVEAACDLTERLISDIPVYELSCTPDRRAVELLKKTLSEEVGGVWQNEK